MKWQSSEISKPLTKILDDNFNETAVSMFSRKNIFKKLKNSSTKIRFINLYRRKKPNQR